MNSFHGKIWLFFNQFYRMRYDANSLFIMRISFIVKFTVIYNNVVWNGIQAIPYANFETVDQMSLTWKEKKKQQI